MVFCFLARYLNCLVGVLIHGYNHVSDHILYKYRPGQYPVHDEPLKNQASGHGVIVVTGIQRSLSAHDVGWTLRFGTVNNTPSAMVR